MMRIKASVLTVTGWPRSGNTHLACLLADALQCPMYGRLRSEGQERVSQYAVEQKHLKASEWKGEPVVSIVRDPRDVAVSAWKFWSRPSLEETIQCMINGSYLRRIGPWANYVDGWDAAKVPTVRYEDLIIYPLDTLAHILDMLGLKYDLDRMTLAVIHQRFDARKAAMAAEQAKVMLRSMRNGKPGDWRNYFDDRLLGIAYIAWGAQMERHGYK
jgi:hypothetical protein